MSNRKHEYLDDFDRPTDDMPSCNCEDADADHLPCPVHAPQPSKAQAPLGRPAKAAQDSKQAEDYYIDKRGCSRENARTYLRSETDEERTERCGAYAEYKVGSEGKGCEHAKGHAGNHGGSSEGLRYIADSPSQEHGGFHSNARETAKTALAELERVKGQLRDAQDGIKMLQAIVANDNIERDELLAALKAVLCKEKGAFNKASAAIAKVENEIQT